MTLPSKFLTNLRDSVMWSRRQLSPFIAKRKEILRQYVGKHYGSAGPKEKVPINYVDMMVSIMAKKLVARQPRCMVTTPSRDLRAIAGAAEQWGNERFVAMGMEKVLQRQSLDALVYPLGMVKVGVCKTDPSYAGPRHDYGQPYVDNIDPERCVHDMAATRWDHLDYVGHRYTIPKDLLKNDPDVDQKVLAKITSGPHSRINEIGIEKTEALSQSSELWYTNLREYIDVWELYLPKENLLVHFPIQGNTILDQPLKIEEYVGPVSEEHAGPFYWLAFDEVPGNLMAKPPVLAIYDLHLDANAIMRKTLRQALRQKTQLLVQATATEEAKRLLDGNDGDAIPVTSAEAFKEVRRGGPDQQNLAFNLNLKQMISWLGGNFDAQAGLGPQSGTVGQDELLKEASNARMQFYQDEVVSAARRIMQGVLWYDWYSKKTLQANMPIPGRPGMSVPIRITPEDRKADFLRFGFQIDPYSMASSSPQQRLNQFMACANYATQVAPILAQQGVMVNFFAIVQKMARYMGINDIDEIFIMAQPDQPQQEEAGPQQVALPPQGKPNGNYVRTNVSSPQNQEMQMMQAMMMNPQQGV